MGVTVVVAVEEAIAVLVAFVLLANVVAVALLLANALAVAATSLVAPFEGGVTVLVVLEDERFML